MSEISQKMGFDASQAITTLGNLDKAIQAMNASVSASPAAFTAFNTKAGKTVAALKHLQSNAKAAAAELQKVANLQGKTGAAVAPKQSAGAGAVGTTPKPPDLSSYIAQLQEMFRVSGSASKEQKRAFQSAITAAAEYAAKHKKSAADIASTNARMAENMTGTANKMANALASISKKAKILPPDTSAYVKKVQALIPLVKNATERQKRAWQSLSSKIATEAKRAGMSVREMAAINRQLGQSLTGSANKIANDMQKMQGSAKQTAKVWTVSWETMARVVATQVIVRALSAIRQQLREGVQDAIAFQKAVAEIATISEGGLGGLGEIGNLVSRVASEWNTTLADTAEAAYQTVSNQIAKSEEDVESFLGTAAKFAKITKTDMSTAVNLLSGTLNAFGKEVGEAESVAAKFFSTIKLGRTRAEELAQSIGSIQPIAGQLGIAMEELNAGVATLTIQGLKTDKVVTQLRGVMQSFLKPTGEMEAAMRTLGFATGEQMLRAFNLQEAMKLLKGTTDGSAQSFAKLVPRVRGMTGGIGLAEDASGSFTNSLNEQRVALGEYDAALLLVTGTAAEKTTKAFNQLKITLATTFGVATLERFAHHLGNINALLTPDSTIISKAIDEVVEMRRSAVNTELELELSLISTREKYYAQMAATARSAYFEAVDAANEANVELVAGTEWALDAIQAPIDAAVAGIKKAAEGIRDAIDASKALGASSLAKTQDILFQRSVARAKDDPVLQIELLRQKGSKASLAAQELATKGKLKEAKVEYGIFLATNKQSHAIIVSSLRLQKTQKSLAAKRDLAGKGYVQGLMRSKVSRQQEVDLDKELAWGQDRFNKALNVGEQVLADSAKGLNKSAREMVVYQARLNALKKTIIETQKQTASGKLTPDDQEALLEKNVKLIAEYGKALDEGVNKFAKDVNPVVRKLFQDIQNINRDVEIETLLNVPANMQSVFDTVRAAAKTYFDASPIGFKIFVQIKGLDVSTPALTDAARVQYTEIQEENARATSKFAEAQEVLRTHLAGTSVAADEMIKKRGKTSEFYNSIYKEMKKISEGEFNLASLDKFLAKLDEGSAKGALGIKAIAVGIRKLRKVVEDIPEKPILKGTFEQYATDSIGFDRYREKAAAAKIAAEELAKSAAVKPQVNLGPVDLTGDIKVFEGLDTAAQQTADSINEVVVETRAEQLALENLSRSLLGLPPLELELEPQVQTQAADPQTAKQAEVAAFTMAEQAKRLQLDQTSAKMSTLQAEADVNPVVPKVDTQPFIMMINGVRHEVEDLPRKVNESINAAGVLQDQVSSVSGAATSVTSSVGGITTALEGSISAAQRLIATLSQAQSMSGPVTASKGGRIGYFASGGRGTDTIPAMLSEGEFVTNAKSSRRFFSQLQAMNAGRTPVYRESGGSTTNIGDVSINVNESSSPRQTGREVMQAFRRETRRGSGRI